MFQLHFKEKDARYLLSDALVLTTYFFDLSLLYYDNSLFQCVAQTIFFMLRAQTIAVS